MKIKMHSFTAFFVACTVLYLVFLGAAVGVVWHFIAKYW